MNCLSEGGPDLRYSWRKNGADECLSSTNTLAIGNLSMANAGDYTCTVTNDAGSGNHSITIYGMFTNYHTNTGVFNCVHC